MAIWLKQSTAVGIKLGPFVSSVDGFTPQTALNISQSDVRLTKGEGNWGQKSDMTPMVHEENGWYQMMLDAIDTDTLGPLVIAVYANGALPVWREFMIMMDTGLPVPASVAKAVWLSPTASMVIAGSAGKTLVNIAADVAPPATRKDEKR